MRRSVVAKAGWSLVGVLVAALWVFPVYWMALSAITPNARLRQIPPNFLPTDATMTNLTSVLEDPVSPRR